MKRELIQNAKIQPFSSGDVIDRNGFTSGIIGVSIGTAGVLTLTVTHSDDGTTFEGVTDACLFPGTRTSGGALTTSSLAKNDLLNEDVDFSGLKRYVKIVSSGAAATDSVLAIVLGDSPIQPV